MVSIIIPCYNVENWIERTIRSVFSQVDRNWELIIVDDGSGDNTYEVANNLCAKDSRIKLFRQENKGVSAARNLGLTHATGDWIYFLDGDDIIDNRLVHKINSIEQDIDVVLTGFEIRTGSKSRFFIPDKSYNIINDFLTFKQKIVMCSICFRKSLLDNNSIRFDEATFYFEDREFITYSLLKAKRIVILKDVLFTYIRRESSATGRKIYDEKSFTSIKACERLCKKLTDTPYHNAVLVQLKATLVLHWRGALHHGCSENLKDRLTIYLAKYLPQKTDLSFNKAVLFAYVASIAYKNDFIFKHFIRLIP